MCVYSVFVYMCIYLLIYIENINTYLYSVYLSMCVYLLVSTYIIYRHTLLYSIYPSLSMCLAGR